MGEKLSLDLEVNDNGTVVVSKFARKSDESMKRLGKSTDKLSDKLSKKLGGGLLKAVKHTGSLTGKVIGLTAKLTLLAGAAAAAGLAFAALALKNLAGDFIAVGSSMDQLKLSLDTITKGEGEETFRKLNEWAMTMPINTKKAVESYSMMRAMGLKPTIADMTTLVDTASALGGGSDAMMGIARALGQIKTKGKASAEELMQLAERGVPVFEILREKLGLTAEEVANIGNMGIEGQQAVDAIMEGLQERFGGQSEKMQNKFAGLWETIKSYWTEFQRMVMDSGVMALIEEKLGGLVEQATQLYEDGSLSEWAADVADAVGEAYDYIDELITKGREWWAENGKMAVDSFKLAYDIVAGYAKLLWWWWNKIGKAIGWVFAKIVGLVEKVQQASTAIANFVGAGDVSVDVAAGGSGVPGAASAPSESATPSSGTSVASKSLKIEVHNHNPVGDINDFTAQKIQIGLDRLAHSEGH